MRSDIVTLDLRFQEVTIVTGEKAYVCSYQEAIDDPKFSAFLLPETKELIALNLETAQ